MQLRVGKRLLKPMKTPGSQNIVLNPQRSLLCQKVRPLNEPGSQDWSFESTENFQIVYIRKDAATICQRYWQQPLFILPSVEK